MFILRVNNNYFINSIYFNILYSDMKSTVTITVLLKYVAILNKNNSLNDGHNMLVYSLILVFKYDIIILNIISYFCKRSSYFVTEFDVLWALITIPILIKMKLKFSSMFKVKCLKVDRISHKLIIF